MPSRYQEHDSFPIPSDFFEKHGRLAGEAKAERHQALERLLHLRSEHGVGEHLRHQPEFVATMEEFLSAHRPIMLGLISRHFPDFENHSLTQEDLAQVISLHLVNFFATNPGPIPDFESLGTMISRDSIRAMEDELGAANLISLSPAAFRRSVFLLKQSDVLQAQLKLDNPAEVAILEMILYQQYHLKLTLEQLQRLDTIVPVVFGARQTSLREIAFLLRERLDVPESGLEAVKTLQQRAQRYLDHLNSLLLSQDQTSWEDLIRAEQTQTDQDFPQGEWESSQSMEIAELMVYFESREREGDQFSSRVTAAIREYLTGDYDSTNEVTDPRHDRPVRRRIPRSLEHWYRLDRQE